jgi:hypothetical protein
MNGNGNGSRPQNWEAELLPWYVTERLTPEERARLERAIEADEDLRDHARQIREEADATVLANEAAGVPSARILHDLMDQIAQESERSPGAASWASRLAEIFALPPLSPGLRVAGAVAAVVIIAQAAVIGALLMRLPGAPEGARYDTAAGPGEAAKIGPGFLVRFTPSSTAEEITAALNAAGLMIAEGPKNGGVYRLAAKDQAQGLPENAEAKLRESGVAALILPAK